MDKITIEIGGFKITANSPEEARGIMGLSPLVRKPNKNDGEYNVPIKIIDKRGHYKKVKKHTHNRWSPEEVEFMSNRMKTESAASVSRSKYLRQRHTESAINMMGWKISKNPSSLKLAPENQAIVDQFQEWKANNK